MHITNQNVIFYDICVIYLRLEIYKISLRYLLDILMIFLHKRKINNFDPYNVLLAIAKNISHRPGFVVQGHK